MAKVLQLCCSCVLVGSALGLKVKWTPANGKKPMPFSKKYREANGGATWENNKDYGAQDGDASGGGGLPMTLLYIALAAVALYL
jgi:hypothetical protein